MFKKLILPGIVLFSMGSAFAARPFVTDDAGIVDTNAFEVEVSANYWKKKADFGFDLKHGLTKRMDIGVGFAYTAVPEDDASFSGLEASLKFAFIPELLSASVSGALGDPLYSVNLIYSKSLGFFTVNANVGSEIEASVKDAVLTYGVATVFKIGNVSPGAEIGGTHEDLNWWQIGAQFSIVDWFALDIGLGGDFESTDNLIATSGLWFTF